VIQSTVLPHLAIAGIKVELTLLLVIAWGIRRGLEESLLWALIGGIAVDLFSAAPFGTSVVSYGCAAAVAGSLGPLLRQVSALLPLAITPLAVVIAALAAAAAMALAGWPVPWPSTVALVILPTMLVDSLAMLVVYPLVSALDPRPRAPAWMI